MTTTPSWTTRPPAEGWRAVVDSAEYAAHSNESRSAAALADSGHDIRLLVIVAIRLLAGVIAEGVSADDIRRGVVELAAQTGAADFTVTTAMETVAMAEALATDNLVALGELCSGSQFSALEHGIMACALAGQAIAAVAADPAGVFDRLRHYWDGAA